MRAVLFITLALALRAEQPIVGVDPRVELLSVVFRLAGSPEYSERRLPAYSDAADAWFAPWRNHAAVQLARDLRLRNSVGYDAVMSFAVHITDVETLAERVPFDMPGIALDSRWGAANARQFLDRLRSFVAETRFVDFLQSQQPMYETANARLRELATRNFDATWFNRFFGPRPVRMGLVPGLLTGSGSYGPRMLDLDGSLGIYSIIGVMLIDSAGNPVFPDGLVSTAVHEFTHSYANPLIDLFAAELGPAGERLFQTQKTQMQTQGYGTAKAVLYESLTRAASARYAAEAKGPAGCDQAVQFEQSRGFLWTGEFTRLLFEYERSRDTYPTLEAFMPRVVSFLNAASIAPAAMPAEYERSRPRVVDVSVAAGTQDVDPELRQIAVRFDRPMLRSYSVLPRIPEYFPLVLGASFDDAALICTISVALEPDRPYELSLNVNGAGWFASAEGVALSPYLVWFHTGKSGIGGVPRQGPARASASAGHAR